MIELALIPKNSIVQLSSNLGCAIQYEVALADLSAEPFDLVSGYYLKDCLINLTVYSEAITNKPWDAEGDSSKLGELSATIAGDPQSLAPPILGIQLFVFDYVFNMLIANHTQEKLPQGVWLGFDEDTFLKPNNAAGQDKPLLVDNIPGVMEKDPSINWYLFNTQKTR